MAGRILLCSKDPALAATRKMVLAVAGFDVSVACSEEAFAALPQNPAVQLAVIGHTLTGKERESEVEAILERWPDAAILYLSLGFQPLEREQCRFTCGTNPIELVEACRKIVSTSRDLSSR